MNQAEGECRATMQVIIVRGRGEGQEQGEEGSMSQLCCGTWRLWPFKLKEWKGMTEL